MPLRKITSDSNGAETMPKAVGIIAHVDHGKMSLTHTMLMILKLQKDLVKSCAVPSDQLGSEQPSASWPELADAENNRDS